jgi:organic hydroperoxide reductase OsmC/OhrA
VATHRYRVAVRWTGDLGEGTRSYRGYSRDHAIEVDGKPPILGSSGLSPRSDPARHNPDELLVAALASCHMLWYLHLCSEAGIVVVGYRDDAEGTLETGPDGGGRFRSATLRPHVVLRAGALEKARELHEEAHRRCFVANSVNFPVAVEPVVERAATPEPPRT